MYLHLYLHLYLHVLVSASISVLENGKARGEPLLRVTVNLDGKDCKKILSFFLWLIYCDGWSTQQPKKISGRKNTTEETLEYFFRQYPEYKIFIDFCILQVTSPLRKISTIKNGIKKFHKTKQNSLVSVKFKSITDKNSNKIFYITDKKKLIPNGVLYISNIENFLKTGKIYNKNSELIVLGSKESIDIDTLEDLKIARNLI